MVLSVEGDADALEQRIGVQRLQAVERHLVPRAGAGRQRKLLDFFQFGPEQILVVLAGVLAELVVEAGSEAEGIEHFMRRSRCDLPIGALDLRPSLFEKHGPYFPAVGLAEDGPVGGGEDGYEIVDDHFRDNAFPVGDHLVDAVSVDCEIPEEDVLDSQRSLSHRGYCGQEIAVSHVALLYIRWVDPVLYHNDVLVQDIRYPLPRDLSVVDGVVEGVLVAGKVLVDELPVVLPALRVQLAVVGGPDHDSCLIGGLFLLTEVGVGLREALVILPLDDDLATLLVGCAIAEIAAEEHAY